MKVMLLAGLYLFFIRVLLSVVSELRDPRTVPRRRVEPVAGADLTQPAPPSVPAVANSGPLHMRGGAVGAAPIGQLRVTEPPEFAGLLYSLGASTTLGRADTNDIILDDTYVSTVHARVFMANGAYFVEDLASRNGTGLNDQLISATTALTIGDLVQIGATTLEFH